MSVFFIYKNQKLYGAFRPDFFIKPHGIPYIVWEKVMNDYLQYKTENGIPVDGDEWAWKIRGVKITDRKSQVSV